MHSMEKSNENNSEVKIFVESLWKETLGLNESWDKTKQFNALNGNQTQWQNVLEKIETRFLISLSGLQDFCIFSRLVTTIEERVQAGKDIIRYYWSGKKSGLFLIHPIMGKAGKLFESAKNLNSDILKPEGLSVYLYQSPLVDDGIEFSTSEDSKYQLLYQNCCDIKKQAQLVIKAIKAVQPHGNYFFLGWSYGGVLTLEIVRQLQAQGSKVKYIGIIDSQLPQQLQALEPQQLIERLLMHINWISSEILKLGEETKVINPNEFNLPKDGKYLIEYAFEITFQNIEKYKSNTAYIKLSKTLYALKANYLAMYSYHPEREENKLTAVTVYVAGEKASALEKNEYAFNDMLGLTDVKPTEPVLKNCNHFDIVETPQFANLVNQHIKNIKQIVLANKFLLKLSEFYNNDYFTSLQSLYDDSAFLLNYCEFNITASNSCNEITNLFNKESRVRYAQIIGNEGIGKTILAQQLVLGKMQDKTLGPQKRWIFYIPMSKVLELIQSENIKPTNRHELIEILLYQIFFGPIGVDFERVKTCWKYIRKHEANSICFILDEDITLDKSKRNHLLESLFNAGVSIIAVGREDQKNTQIGELGFSHPIFRVENKILNLVNRIIKELFDSIAQIYVGDILELKVTEEDIELRTDFYYPNGNKEAIKENLRTVISKQLSLFANQLQDFDIQNFVSNIVSESKIFATDFLESTPILGSMCKMIMQKKPKQGMVKVIEENITDENIREWIEITINMNKKTASILSNNFVIDHHRSFASIIPTNNITNIANISTTISTTTTTLIENDNKNSFIKNSEKNTTRKQEEIPEEKASDKFAQT